MGIREKRVKTYDELGFTDDFMFCKILENNLHICKKLIEVILNEEIRIIESVSKQKMIELTPDGRGIRLDVQLVADGRIFNIEMQNVNKGNLALRSRYYQSLMDLDQMERGSEFSQLRDTTIIFMCTFDPIGRGLGKYTVQQNIVEDPKMGYNDGTRKIFVSSTPESTEGLSEEMRDLIDYMNGSSLHGELAVEIEKELMNSRHEKSWRKEYMFLEEKYRDYMIEGREAGLEMGREEGLEIGREEGRKKGLKEGRKEGKSSTEARIVRNMLNKGVDVKDIVRVGLI